LKLRLELESRNIEIEELKRKGKNLEAVGKKCSEKNKQLRSEKEDIKRECDLKLESAQKEFNEKIYKIKSEKEIIEKNCNTLEIELNALKIKQEKKIDTNVEIVLEQKDAECKALKEQNREIETALKKQKDDLSQKDDIIQGLKENDSKMTLSLQEMKDAKNIMQKDSKALRKKFLDVKRILAIRNRELKIYQDIVGQADSDEDGDDDEMETSKSIIREEIRSQSGVEPSEDISEGVEVKEEVNMPKTQRGTNVGPFPVIILDE
jgi:chromosome segregation ATPase